MLNFQAMRLLHRHGNGEYVALVESAERSSAANDPERQWVRGTRIFSCSGCTDEIVVEPAEGANEQAQDPTA